MASLLPGLRRVTPRVSRDFFICHNCRTFGLSTARLKVPVKTSTLRSIRFNSQATAFPKAGTPLASLGGSIKTKATDVWKGQGDGKTGGYFPQYTSNTVAYWLLGSAASVFGIVVFGGLTRLTESGLSITEWKPVTGSLPPLSLRDWESEFDKYRASPEFKLLNPHMTLEEFKKIYYMEWGHRLWGRVVGLSFVLPAIYFVARRRVSASMTRRLIGISSLIGFQGFLGWYMVKSGLKDDLFAPGSHPRVSQYRLAAHLGTAFICYMTMVWNGLSILRINKLLAGSLPQSFSWLDSDSLKRIRLRNKFLLVLVFATAMSGALVAGLDAGLIYNEFPYMGNGLTPPKSELFSTFYSRKEDHSDLVWRNMFENPSLVQLTHRILAVTSFSSVIAFWAWRRHHAKNQTYLRALKGPLRHVVYLVFIQATLGISTLIYLVPIPLAAAHQAGALALITGVLALGSRMSIPTALRPLMQRWRVARDATMKAKVSHAPTRGPKITHHSARSNVMQGNYKSPASART